METVELAATLASATAAGAAGAAAATLAATSVAVWAAADKKATAAFVVVEARAGSGVVVAVVTVPANIRQWSTAQAQLVQQRHPWPKSRP